MLGFAQIRRNSNGICSNPASIWFFFAQISWVLHKFGDDLIFFSLDLVSLAQIQWWFDFFCSNLVSFAQIRRKIQIAVQKEPPTASSSSSTDLTADQSNPIRPNVFIFLVGGGFSRWKPKVIKSVAGWAQTRPGSTHGHP